MGRDEFNRLIEEHYSAIYRVAASYSTSAAEDIVQVASLRAWQNIGRLEDPTKFAAWLHVITRNTARNWLRDHPPAPRLPDVPAPSGGSLTELVESLPEELREVIRLRYTGGMSYREIAEMLEIPLSAVKDRLFRAKKKLKG